MITRLIAQQPYLQHINKMSQKGEIWYELGGLGGNVASTCEEFENNRGGIFSCF